MTTINIAVRNFRRVASADLSVSGLALVAGQNGNGKTSLGQAVAAALTGFVIPAALDVKKSSAGALVRNGTSKAEVVVGFDDANAAKASYPKAEYQTKGKPPQASEYAAGASHLIDLEPKHRASVLAKYLKSEADQADFMRAAEEAGLPETWAAATWPKIVKDGWDKVLKDATEYGQKQKGRWEQITGEKAYQPTGADNWTPSGWSADLAAISVEKLKADEVAALENLEKAIGQGALDNAVLVSLRAAAKDPEGDLAKLRAAIETAKAKVADCEAKLAALPQPETVPETVACPHCGAESAVRHDPSQPAGSRYTLTVDVSGLSAEENQARATDIHFANQNLGISRTELKVAENALATFEQAVARAKKAKAELAEAEAKPDNSEEIAAARAKVDEIAARHLAKITKTDADKAHGDIKKNTILIGLLKPEGLRKKKLGEAVTAFNASRLAPICKDAGWDFVELDADTLTFSYGGFPFSHLGESHQYRVRVAVQIAMARLDGSDMVVIDRADLLDRKGRIGLIQMLAKAKIPALVLATYNTPDQLPELWKMPGGSCWWIEGGALRLVTGPEAQAQQAAE